MLEDVLRIYKFYDLADALTPMATGYGKRSYCVVCKQGYIPAVMDVSRNGWQEDFPTDIGLEDLVKANYCQIRGKILSN